jgi:lysophospholipase L1-like esterase
VSRTLRRRARRIRSRFTRLGLGVLTAALILAGLELGARLVFVGPPDWRGLERGEDELLEGHPTRLWQLAPGHYALAGAKTTVHDGRLRGAAPAGPRPDGVERVVLIGDSSWFGYRVADDETLAVQLEERLAGSGIAAEVLNAAVPGYSTEQSSLLIEEVVWELEPTLLVLASFWSDASFDRFPDRDLMALAASHRVRLLGRSALFRALAVSLDLMRGGRGARIVSWPQLGAAQREGCRRVPVAHYAANLDTMVRAARRRGVGAAFIAPGHAVILDEGDHRTPSWGAYFDAQEQVAAHHSLPLVRAYDALGAAADDQGSEALFVDGLHPSGRGHAVIAQALEGALREAGWPRERLLGREEPFDASAVGESARGGQGAVIDRSPTQGSPQWSLYPQR